MKKPKKQKLTAALDEIRVLLQEINQKVEHLIKRLPKHCHSPHDHPLSDFMN